VASGIAGPGLGDGDDDDDDDGELEGLALALGERLADGDGLTLALGLLIISRTATCTAARSSLVPDENPTERDPCPAVVSRTTTAPLFPKSIDWISVLLAPAVGSVCKPVAIPAKRIELTPVEPSVTLCSASVPSSCSSTIPAA
jgi:hypothetical protein